MYKEHFANMEWTALPIIALVMFLAMFVLMLLRTFAYKTKQDFEPVAQLPLNDGMPVTQTQNEVQP